MVSPATTLFIYWMFIGVFIRLSFVSSVCKELAVLVLILKFAVLRLFVVIVWKVILMINFIIHLPVSNRFYVPAGFWVNAFPFLSGNFTTCWLLMWFNFSFVFYLEAIFISHYKVVVGSRRLCFDLKDLFYVGRLLCFGKISLCFVLGNFYSVISNCFGFLWISLPDWFGCVWLFELYCGSLVIYVESMIHN